MPHVTIPLLGRVLGAVMDLARPAYEPEPRDLEPCERCGEPSACRYFTPAGQVPLCLPHALDVIGRGRARGGLIP